MTNIVLKLIIVGDTHTGKTAIATRFVDEMFDTARQSTIGIEFRVKRVNINNNTILLHIWDTAGQERFNAIVRSFYRGCAGSLVVFDLTNRYSFMSAKNKWIPQLQADEPNCEILLVGNKCESVADREVSEEEVASLCRDRNITYIETSAKNNINIANAFTTLCEIIFANKDISMFKSTPSCQLLKQEEVKTTLCCKYI